MAFSINNPAKHAKLTLVGTGGAVMAVVEKDLTGSRPGAPLSLTWQPPQGDLLYMDLRVTDVAGFWKGVRLTPFSVEIPHDDVVFDTDRWDIKRSEEPKLKSTLAKIREALDKHGKLLQLKLYVAGYTDTVGGKQHNQRLSDNRARSIATWFRNQGLRIPIFYQGFGEDALKVNTPDETDEQRNRRALYLLASQRPPKGRELPRDDWKGI
jgi:outer membrane protein OmpA-like peptidoglycan-associated protein